MNFTDPLQASPLENSGKPRSWIIKWHSLEQPSVLSEIKEPERYHLTDIGFKALAVKTACLSLNATEQIMLIINQFLGFQGTPAHSH